MCSADSRPSAVFKWFLNGALLSDTGLDLSLMNVQISQSGNYSCQAFNNKTLRYEMTQPASISVLSKFENKLFVQRKQIQNGMYSTCDFSIRCNCLKKMFITNICVTKRNNAFATKEVLQYLLLQEQLRLRIEVYGVTQKYMELKAKIKHVY